MQKVDDPSATYRGYRRQALYCLFRLFEDGLPENYILQPEGIEDLAIFDASGVLLEVVQVKDYSSPLVASDFTSFFYERIAQYCQPTSKVKVTLASFGAIGSELAMALDTSSNIPKRTLKTVKGETLSDTQASQILNHIQYVQLEDEKLTEIVFSKLRKSVAAGQPQQAFDNFMWWLFTASEKRTEITRKVVIERLNNIGKFLAQRNSHISEWNVSILPISLLTPHQSTEILEREFLQGGRVRFEHIAANLDIPRNQVLAEINNAFLKNNIVVVHAASGQGKTTLAYRYLLEFCAAEFCFEILRPSDTIHARRMAIALAGHYESLQVPTFIYLDVRPGDNAWKEFVREVSGISGIQVLITIREEDWFLSRITVDDFFFADIQPQFDENTAMLLFGSLNEKYKVTHYLDFDDAWKQLGERKTLFEFVYLLTQNQSLTFKIKQQVSALQDEVNEGKLTCNELKLLRLVAVASAYEARIRLIDLVNLCDIAEPQRTLQRFNNEFLLRTSIDGHYVEGFHSVRSEIICSQLLDEVFYPWPSLAKQVLPILEENDLEFFLLCTFSRHYHDSKELISALSSLSLTTWEAVRGVGRSLQWLGLKEYALVNAEVLSDARTLVGQAWWMLIDFDIANALKVKNDLFAPLAASNPNFAIAAQAAMALKEKQTNKMDIFNYFSDFLGSLLYFPRNPQSILEFDAFAEIIFWLGHINLKVDYELIANDDLDAALTILPVYSFARLAIATRTFNENLYSSWFDLNKEKLKKHIQEKEGIFALDQEDDCLVAHYIIRQNNRMSGMGLSRSKPDTLVTYNDLSVERVETIAWCIPNFNKYGSSGYGNKTSLLELPYDDTVKRMPIENILKPWLPIFNSWFQGLVDYQARPKEWSEYFSQIYKLRRDAVYSLKQIGIVLHDIGSKDIQFITDMKEWNSFRRLTTDNFLLPKSALDEWGMITESQAKETSNLRNSQRFLASKRLSDFKVALNEYRHRVGDFVRSAEKALILMVLMPSAKAKDQVEELYALAEKEGINKHDIHLSVCNGIDACIMLKKLHQQEEVLTNPQSLDFLSPKEEYEAWIETIYKWCRAAYPEQFPLMEGKLQKTKRKLTKGMLSDCLIPTSNRLNSSLKLLKKRGVHAKIHADNIYWKGNNALWITFDVEHPIDSLNALDALWQAIASALNIDQDKIVRIKAMDLYWQHIILIPLVKGKSLERLAYTNFKGVMEYDIDVISSQRWRLFPEPISSDVLDALGIRQWAYLGKTDLIDSFVNSYGELFEHIDYLSNFNKQIQGMDDIGTDVLRNYLEDEEVAINSHAQKTFDSMAELTNYFSDQDLTLLSETRPNIFVCLNLILEISTALYPIESFQNTASLTLEQIASWRDRLHISLTSVGFLKYLWIADMIGCNEPNLN